MFLRPFGLYFSACFGSLFVFILCTCFSHFSWYCFISCTMFCAPVFCLLHIWSYLAEFFVECEMFQTKVVEKIKTHILCSTTFPEKSYRLWDNVEKRGRAGHTRDDNMLRRMRFACWITRATVKLRVCSTYCFSTAKMVKRTRLNVTFIHTSSVLLRLLSSWTGLGGGGVWRLFYPVTLVRLKLFLGFSYSPVKFWTLESQVKPISAQIQPNSWIKASVNIWVYLPLSSRAYLACSSIAVCCGLPVRLW